VKFETVPGFAVALEAIRGEARGHTSRAVNASLAGGSA
jgi:hypothetical protein